MSATLVSLTEEKSFPLNRPSNFVGRDRWRVDVQLSGDGVDDVHCELVQEQTGFRLINLSSKGTQVNGKTVTETVLRDGDELTIAAHRLRLCCIDASRAQVVWSDAAAEAEWAAVNHFEPGQEGASECAVSERDRSGVTASSPVPRIESPESHRWLVQLAGMELGPMSWSELQKMVQTGEVQVADPVCPEGTDAWRPYSEVLAGAGEAPVQSSSTQNPPQSVPALFRSEFRKLDGQDQEKTEEVSVPGTSPGENISPAADSEDAAPVHLPAIEPQYYVILDESESSVETGPVPFEALQQLALEHRLTGVTRVRREDETEWSAAGTLAIDFPSVPDPEFERPAERPGENQTAALPESRSLMAGVVWLFLAPVYTLFDAIRGLQGMPKKTIVVTAVFAVTAGVLLATWVRGWSQTALTGTLTLDGEPVPAVVVTLTGMTTGDSAVGVTDSSGRFSAITLDGELLPGNYHVTVERSDSASGQVNDGPMRIPGKYQSIGTTDLIIEVKEGVSTCDIPLTAKISGTLVDEGR